MPDRVITTKAEWCQMEVSRWIQETYGKNTDESREWYEKWTFFCDEDRMADEGYQNFPTVGIAHEGNGDWPNELFYSPFTDSWALQGVQIMPVSSWLLAIWEEN